VVNYQFPKKRIALGPRSNLEYHQVIRARRKSATDREAASTIL